MASQRIRPLATSRSVVRLDAERAQKRVAHWQAVVIAACEQSGRNSVPQVLPVTEFSRLAGARGRATGDNAARAVGAVRAGRAARFAAASGGVTLLAGPEGGLSPEEQHDAQASGFTPVRLGPRVLRTETAALAALGAMQTLWGDF